MNQCRLQQVLVGFDVTNHDTQQKISLARNRVALDDFRDFRHGFLESVQGIFLMPAQRHIDEHVNAKAQFVGVQQRDTITNEAGLGQALDPSPTRRVGKPDTRPEVLNRQVATGWSSRKIERSMESSFSPRVAILTLSPNLLP